ncbi:hypothetical protein ACI7RC_02345 [Brevibacillus sp. B_LB10_24]|uniref:hypothetical protein n=1 Tax=Brevibacillus sp. B_LB10_24 TaxID=3380645 RepID=UPI0038B6E2E7
MVAGMLVPVLDKPFHFHSLLFSPALYSEIKPRSEHKHLKVILEVREEKQVNLPTGMVKKAEQTALSFAKAEEQAKVTHRNALVEQNLLVLLKANDCIFLGTVLIISLSKKIDE